MTDESQKQLIEALVQRLTRETGITEAESRLLIATIGMNWPSLVFNARTLKAPK